MPKIGMQPIRRRQLIDATISSIHAHGLGETTVAKIARRAGVSSGIIHHYFTGKDDLLAATMRTLLSDLQTGVAARLRAADSPRARLVAIVDGNFAAEQFSAEVMTAWLAFYGEAVHSPALKRIARIYAARLRSNLLHALRHGRTAAEAEMIADTVAALIDGIWLKEALKAGSVDPARARAIVMNTLDTLAGERA